MEDSDIQIKVYKRINYIFKSESLRLKSQAFFLLWNAMCDYLVCCIFIDFVVINFIMLMVEALEIQTLEVHLKIGKI